MLKNWEKNQVVGARHRAYFLEERTPHLSTPTRSLPKALIGGPSRRASRGQRKSSGPGSMLVEEVSGMQPVSYVPHMETRERIENLCAMYISHCKSDHFNLNRTSLYL